jgi:hypothetical protein
MSEKKLFSTISALIVGAVAGLGVASTPVVAVAEHADGHEKGDHKCSGDTKCGGEKKCSGDHGDHGDHGESADEHKE